jgi:hypothetical protein
VVENAGRVGEQHEAYRRGLVLGLTMAEVGILIIFVLLLLIAFAELEREKVATALRGKLSIDSARLAKLESAQTTLDNIAAGLGIPPKTQDEDFQKLIKVVQAAAGPGPAKTALEAAREQIERLKNAADSLEKIAQHAQGKGPEAIADQLERQAEKIANQEGQLKYFENKLAETGNGKDERPCWVRPDGTIEYLYEVVLVSSGIQMREYENPERAVERARLPMPIVDPQAVLAPDEFLRVTRPLYNESLAENCRFFVVIYDGTEPYEKGVYKSLLRTVESHFYKRLANAPRPF